MTREADGDNVLVAAIAGGRAMQEQLYTRYRNMLLRVFLQRRIDRDAAQDLLQRTFLQAIQKIRSNGLADPDNLGGYLYRTACKLAIAYWRGEIARRHGASGDRELGSIEDDSLPLDELIDHDLLARAVRSLIGRLAVPRDREVLQRFYLQEEAKDSICRSLALTDLQFNQVLWRARQRLCEMARREEGLRATGYRLQPE